MVHSATSQCHDTTPSVCVRPSSGARLRESFRLSEAVVAELKSSQSVQRLVELQHLTRELTLEESEYELVQHALRGARSRLGFDRLAVYLREGETVCGTVGTSERGDLVDERGYRAQFSDLPEREMLEKAFSEPDYFAAQEGVELCIGKRVAGRGWNALASLWARDEAIGWIACDNLVTAAPWSPFELDLLKLFAAALASAIVQKRLERRLRQSNRELQARVREQSEELVEVGRKLERSQEGLEKLSRVDALTGVFNRRAFDESLLSEWGRCARESAELSIVLIDVDRFGAYNERFGAAEADLVLKRVADTLGRCAKRPGDLLARSGSDEFVLLLPKTGQLGAGRFAELCREAVFDLNIEHPDSQQSQRLTVSVGVATARPPRGSAQACFEAADSGQVDGKRRGGNRVVHHRE